MKGNTCTATVIIVGTTVALHKETTTCLNRVVWYLVNLGIHSSGVLGNVYFSLCGERVACRVPTYSLLEGNYWSTSLSCSYYIDYKTFNNRTMYCENIFLKETGNS